MATAIDRSWPSDNALPINLFDIASDGSPLGSDYSQALGSAVPKLLMLPSTGASNNLATLQRIARLRVS